MTLQQIIFWSTIVAVALFAWFLGTEFGEAIRDKPAVKKVRQFLKDLYGVEEDE